MRRKIGKILAWTILSLTVLLLLVFLYVWFIVLARPAEIAKADELKDNEWHTVALKGETSCSDGSPYAIFTRKGNSDNLIIHFAGGGACWDSLTCTAPLGFADLFTPETAPLTKFYIPEIFKIVPALLTGVTDNKDEGNPFRDWNIVYIPYCTGDLHIGNNVTNYVFDGKEYKVQHNGRNNVGAALQWIYDNHKVSGKILVSGESAGAYASAFYAPSVASHYANNKIYQLSDAAAITSSRWNEIANNRWKAETTTHLHFSVDREIYADALLQRNDSTRDRVKHLHSNTTHDAVLTKFGAALNHLSTANREYINTWNADMRQTMQRLEDAGINYQYFLSNCNYDPATHTTPHMLAGLNYHRCNENEVTYPEWLKRNIIDDEPLSVGTAWLQTESSSRK